jgi:hypothetical protein
LGTPIGKGPSGIKAIGAPSFPVRVGANVSAACALPFSMNGGMISRIPNVMKQTRCANTNGDIPYSPLMALTRMCMISFRKYHILPAIMNLLPSEVLVMMPNVRQVRNRKEKVKRKLAEG